MQKVDERFLIHGHIHGFYLTPRQITEILGCSDRHARTIINGRPGNRSQRDGTTDMPSWIPVISGVNIYAILRLRKIPPAVK